MKLLIDKKVSIGFLLALLTLVILIILSFRNQQYYFDTTREIIRRNDIISNAEKLYKHLLELETAQRGFIITGDSSFLIRYRSGSKESLETLDKLTAAIDGLSEYGEMLANLKRLTRERINFADTAVQALNTNHEFSQRVVASLRGKRLMDEIRDFTIGVHAQALSEGEEFRAQREDFMTNFNITLMIIMGTAVLLLTGLFFLINRSIQVRAAADEQVRMLNTELEAFTYSVSHDLRSPLRVIDGYALILQEDYTDKLDAEGRETVETIVRNVRKMGQLIEDLLEFSRVSKTDLRESKIEFTPMVRRIANDITAQTGCSHCVIEIKDLHPAFADLKMMEQVWMNLIANAVKYSSKREKPLIEIGSQTHATYTTYYIKDNGVGFSMLFKDKLFGIFQRLHRPEDFPGTGVGLAIIKRIVHRHGGKVWADSVVDRGATFYFSLPNQ
jgi:signal transduction histidine kinase